MTQTRSTDLISLDESLPRCAAHPDRVSYVRCRRCDEPMCPSCRTASDVGEICRACTRRLRDEDSDLVGPPFPAATVTTCVILLLLAVAQQLSPQIARFTAFAPFAAVSSPWRFLTGLVTFVGASPALAALPFVASLALAGYAVESLRGIGNTLTTLLVCGVSGFAVLFLASATGSAAWYQGAATPAAAAVGLVISGAVASFSLKRTRPAIMAGLAVALLAAGCLAAPVPVLQLLGGAVAALLMEVIRVFFHKPQRHLTPLLVSGISTGAVALVAVVIGAFVK